MLCPKCGMEVEEGKLVCPFCGVVFAKVFEEQANPFPPEETTQPAIITQTTEPERSGPSPLRYLILLLIGAVVAGLFFFRGPTGELPASELHPFANTRSTDPFRESGKDVYVVVYLAPWCPACKTTVRTVNQLADIWKTSDDIGFVTFVGDGSRDELEFMAEDIEAPTYLDLDGSASRSLGVRAFPTWVVARSDGTIVRKFSGTWRPLKAHIEKLRLADL